MLVLTKNSDQITYFKFFVQKFLNYKGLDSSQTKFLNYSTFNSFSFAYWKFQKLFDNNFNSQPSNTYIRHYKSTLKTFIKNSQNIQVYQFLKILNSYIINWKIKNNCTSLFLLIASQLDIYLYRLLWKWAKRKHPRRNNSWIYAKYWKSFGGVWKFFSINTVTGNLVFLMSHFSIQTSRLYLLPRSLQIFNLNNYQKLNLLWFNKSMINFDMLYRLLWNQQKGLCFNCFRAISYFHFNKFKIVKNLKAFKIVNIQFSQFILVHLICTV